ncbi:uncharacterized protein [Desmodus rotundus]|uniref:uncharacterized protein n=1 Tax=Desmodus rotundus TaxID=9430 RepID=UPI0039E3614D
MRSSMMCHFCGSFRKKLAHPCPEGQADWRFLGVLKSFTHSAVSHPTRTGPPLLPSSRSGEWPGSTPSAGGGESRARGTGSVICQFQASLLRWPLARRKPRGCTPGPQANVPVSSPSGPPWSLGGPGAPACTPRLLLSCREFSRKHLFPLPPRWHFLPLPIPAVTTSQLHEPGRRAGDRDFVATLPVLGPSGLSFAGSPWKGRDSIPLSHSRKGRAGGPRGHGRPGSGRAWGLKAGSWVQSSPSAPWGWQAGPSGTFHDRKAAQGVLCDGIWGPSLGTERQWAATAVRPSVPQRRPLSTKGLEGPTRPQG